MRLLVLLSWPHAKRHLLRTVLTTAGVVLGIAVFVGMHTANQSVLLAFSQTIDRIAGRDGASDHRRRGWLWRRRAGEGPGLGAVRVAVPVIEAVVDPDCRAKAICSCSAST